MAKLFQGIIIGQATPTPSPQVSTAFWLAISGLGLTAAPSISVLQMDYPILL